MGNGAACLCCALLQGAELVIFDEAMGALDPETSGVVSDCIEKRALTLMVVAHP